MTPTPLRTLDGRVVLVSGSTRGIGRAIAIESAARGARVTVTGRTELAGHSVVDEIRSRGGEAMFVRTDVTVEDAVAAAVAATVERWGSLDGVVCNAAAMELTRIDGPITEIDLDAWNQIIHADLTSVFLTAKHGMRAMLDGGNGGSVVLIASMAATRGLNGLDAYTAAKGGVVSMTRSIASYYARYDIRCNCLVVGFVDSGSAVIGESTGLPPEEDRRLWTHGLGRLGKPEDIGREAAHLLSDDAAYISGAILPIDGGTTAASHLPRPGAADLPGRTRLRPLAPSC